MSIRDAVFGVLYLVMIGGVIVMALMGVCEWWTNRYNRKQDRR